MYRTTSVLLVVFLLFSGSVSGQKGRMTLEEYVRTYRDFAIEEMNRSGVPASITLAQAILESDCGNSTLARKANNHFGIKCHKNWEGKTHFHDDDSPNECFRKYESVLDSYRDHSDFLKNTPRYADLFRLRPDDYKGWARGLKKAGYATSPTYAEQLIRIIEENHLHQYDLATIPKKKREAGEVKAPAGVQPETEAEFTVDIVPHRVYVRNHTDYIIAREGDTYEKITNEMNLMPWELALFNDMSKDTPIRAGDVLYLEPKRNRAERGFDAHVVEKGETMHLIAQKYAIKLRQLYRLNRMKEGTEPAEGERIFLRHRRKADDVVRTVVPDQNGEPKGPGSL